MFSFNFSRDHIFQRDPNLQIVKFKLFVSSEKCHSDSKISFDLKSFNGPCCYHIIFIILFPNLLYVCNHSEQNGFFYLFIFNKASKQKIVANINLLYFKEEIKKKNRSKIFKMKTIKTWTILTIFYYHQKLPCFLWSWEKNHCGTRNCLDLNWFIVLFMFLAQYYGQSILQPSLGVQSVRTECFFFF